MRDAVPGPATQGGAVELALAQPFCGDPFFPRVYRGASVQGPGVRIGARVAEEHRVARMRRHLQAHVGEGGGAALGGRVQVQHQCRHTLAAPAHQGGGAALGGVEIVVVRLVFGARAVAQHLQALAMLHGPVHQPGNARLDALDQRRFTALEKHALAGAVGVDFFTASGRGHGERARHARARSVDQRSAFLGREQVAQQHDARVCQGHEHVHRAVANIDARGGALQRRLGQVRGRCGLWRGGCGSVRGQGFLGGLAGHLGVPAGLAHGIDQGG